MNVTEWLRASLEQTTIETKDGGSYTYQKVRDRALCADGMTVSIQHSETMYCSPRCDGETYFLSVEIGYPSQLPPESWRTSDGEVWGWVPMDEIEEWIAAHGGIVGKEER